MLSRFSDVLQTAADVLAPPATRFEDFEYHWKQMLNYFQSYNDSEKVQIEETKVPYHLHQMLQLIIEEENEQQGGTVGPCLESLVQRSIALLDALTVLTLTDRPPGARALALNTSTTLLRRMQQPCLNNSNIYKPLQRMLVQCSETQASPTEKEEVELLLTLCGLVRKDPGLANIFTTPFVEDKQTLLTIPEDVTKLIPLKKAEKIPKKNPLFENINQHSTSYVSIVRNSCTDSDDNMSCKSKATIYDDNDKFLLVDLLISYLSSADNQVVLRACEGIMIVSSLPNDDIASLITTCSSMCECLIEKLVDKYKAIPANVDPCDVDHLNITWGYVAQDFGDKNYNRFHGFRELTTFFSWLDYSDTLMKECHPTISSHLARTFRQNFLEGTVENGFRDLHHTVVVTAVVSKCLKVVDSAELINEFSNWLVGDGEISEWPLLLQIINNCLTDHHDLTLETLKFFEIIIEKPTEHSLQRLLLSRLSSRGYYSQCAYKYQEDDERDRLNDVSLWQERERNREAMKQLQHEDHVNEQINDILSHEGLDCKDGDSDDVHRIINSFLLLLPRAILSDPIGADYEQYIHDAHKHYQMWLDSTSTFRWPSDVNWIDNTASSTHSYDSRPEADVHLDELFQKEGSYKSNSAEPEIFDEGPFLKMIYTLLNSLPTQPYQINLHLTAIISKLAMLPHANSHEYFLNTMLPVAHKTKTLYKVLQDLAKKMAVDVPKIRNYKSVVENVRLQLMSEDPAYDESGDHNELVESLIVLEEFCKELAAIAFVKYQHGFTFR